MEYLGIILFLWILGGTGVIAMWADRITRNSSSDLLGRPFPERVAGVRDHG